MTSIDPRTGSKSTSAQPPTRSAENVIVLEPVVDASGNVVWAATEEAVAAGAQRPADQAGSTVGASADPAEISGTGAQDDIRQWLAGESGCDGPPVADMQTANGALQDPVTRKPVSVLPQERMATAPDAWSDIIRNLGKAEDGRPHQDVEMQPGGTLEVQSAGQARPLSRLPQEKMAGHNPEPTAEDIQEVMHLDPQRVEQWTPVTTGLLNGWKFRLRPAPEEREFVFLAFRSPSDGNRFRVFVIKPDVDDRFGHHDHMIKTSVGGHSIPVLCGPGGRAANTLAEARLFAGKWMAYTYLRSTLGVRPGFSE